MLHKQLANPKSISKIIASLCVIFCLCFFNQADAAARNNNANNMEIMSLNLSHPFLVSVSKGTLYGNIVSDWEIGLGGGKFGVGFGMQEQQSFVAFKAVVMYKWKEPFGDQPNMESLIDQVDFINNRWYYGTEGVLSTGGYRIALQAYRLASVHGDDPDETLLGASVGLGF